MPAKASGAVCVCVCVCLSVCVCGCVCVSLQRCQVRLPPLVADPASPAWHAVRREYLQRPGVLPAPLQGTYDASEQSIPQCPVVLYVLL